MNSGEDISSIIEKIINNPEFAGLVKEIKGEGSVSDDESMKNEMLSKLPDVMAMISPLVGDNNYGVKREEIPMVEDGVAAESKPVSGNVILNGGKYDKVKAEKLLFALKPYLRKNRCEIIDKCVSVMQLTDIMGSFKLLESLNNHKDGR